MKHLLLALLISACVTTPDGSVDLNALADQVELVRLDIADIAPLGKPETQARMIRLDAAILRVEDALRVAGAGGPVSDVTSAARAALDLADVLAQEVAPDSDARIFIGFARIALRHLAAAKFEDAEKALEPASPASI